MNTALTPEESAIYQAYRDKENEKARKRRERVKTSRPPKPEKLTVKSILEKRRAGAALTTEETDIYNALSGKAK